jgi:hypothetical protein
MKIFSKTHRAKKKKVQLYWQGDLMAIKKSNVVCVHRRNISQYDSGERCGPWASCYKYLSFEEDLALHLNNLTFPLYPRMICTKFD